MLAVKGGARAVPEGAIAPWPHVTDEDRDAVWDALNVATPWRWPIEPVKELEAAWAEYVGTDHAIACNSGTAALHMCVAACGIGPGDEVLVPADTFLASASCVLQANAVPVFVDVDPETYNIDPKKIEERISGRTRAIIAVDVNGLPADYDALAQVAERHDLNVIEDGAQAHGASYKGGPVGSLGDVAGCSLNGSKCLSALGEGGLFTTDDERKRDYAERVLTFGERLRDRAERDYDARVMGWNYRLDPLEAAFARSQLLRLPEMTARRTENGARLTEVLSEILGIRTPAVPEGTTHVYFFYPLLVEPEALGLDEDIPVKIFRQTLRHVLQAEGLPIQEWQRRPVPGQTFFKEMVGYGRGCPWSCSHARPGISYRPEEYPVAEDICERRLVMGGSFSPFGPPNGAELMDLYAEAFHKVLVEHRRELVDIAWSAACVAEAVS